MSFPDVIGRNLGKKLRLFTRAKTVQTPSKLDISDLQGVYAVSSLEPQNLMCHRRDAIVVPIAGSFATTWQFSNFSELDEMWRSARRVTYDGASFQLEAGGDEVNYNVRLFGTDENGQQSGVILDGGVTAGGTEPNFTRFFTTLTTNRNTLNGSARVFEITTGLVEEVTGLNIFGLIIEFTNPNATTFGVINQHAYLNFWF